MSLKEFFNAMHDFASNMKFFNKINILTVLSVIGAGQNLVASDFHSGRTAGLSGSGHAAPLLNDAIFLNPAFEAFLPTYSLGAAYLKSNAGRNYSVSLQDGRAELFQAGVAYTVREDTTFVHVGTSKSFIQRTGVGLGGKFYFSNATRTGGRDLIFSVTGVPTEWFSTALVIDNLLQTDAGTSRGFYRELIIATKFNIEKIFLIYFDPHLAPSAPVAGGYGFEGGLEFVFGTDLFLRVGASKNAYIPWLAQRGRGYSAGIGWLSPRMAFDYAISRAIEPRAVTAHVFGLTLYF